MVAMQENKPLHMIACDCGNSSIRVMLGTFDGGKIEVDTVLSEPNDMIAVGDYYYWDILRVFDTIKRGLAKALTQVDQIDSVGICTWGVDFAFFDQEGHMLANPLSYRNTIGAEAMEGIDKQVLNEMFFETGILSDKINSVYMLKGMQEKMPSLVRAGDKLLMIPDILNYFLTGVMMNEPSENSTTQLLDARTMNISEKACEKMGVPKTLFSPIGKHGTLIGHLQPKLKEELDLTYEIPVVCVPSHDTASAVLSIPAKEETYAFVSSGTWALIGAELEEPILSDAIIRANLTNEVGAFEHITLLKNSAGMFLIQRLKKEYEELQGNKITWEAFNALAEKDTNPPALFDVNATRFFNPIKMSEAIWDDLLASGQATGTMDWSVLMNAVHHSMACSYATVLLDLEKVTGAKLHKAYVVGGGAKNDYINHLCADITGWEIVTCAAESASVGNLASQVKYFHPELAYADLKAIVADSLDYQTLYPRENKAHILEAYQNL